MRIWELHNGNLLFKFNTHTQALRSIINWDDNFLLVAGFDCIVILDTKNQFCTIIPEKSNQYRTSLIKFIHPTQGECLLSGGVKVIRLRSFS